MHFGTPSIRSTVTFDALHAWHSPFMQSGRYCLLKFFARCRGYARGNGADTALHANMM